MGFTRGGRVFQYVYQLKDHLGNNRLTFAKNVGRPGVSILDETNYYPFGMPHKNYNVTKLQFEESNGAIDLVNCMDCKYKYKYNGKEWQNELGLNMTAMDWRLYDNALGRFHAVDKFAELAPSITPYRFGFNNPIYWSDAAGLFESREAAMAHIGEYGLENATVSYNRGRWEVKNGSHSFWDKGDGDIGYSYAISHGLGYGTVTGGGSSGNQGGYGGFLIWGTQRDGDQTGHRGSASASVKWNDFVQPMKPQSLNNRAKPGLWEYIKSLFSNSATTYSQATTIQEKLKEMENNSTQEGKNQTPTVQQAIEVTIRVYSLDTISLSGRYLTTSHKDVRATQSQIDSLNNVNDKFKSDYQLWLDHVNSLNK